MEFIWDENKNQINITKHKVSFEEAQTAFSDTFGKLIHDPDHSEDEDRFILLALSSRIRLLIVCHCYREQNGDEEVIRIISARKATKSEARNYGGLQ
jgi:uncharacterized DUF497 family protein